MIPAALWLFFMMWVGATVLAVVSWRAGAFQEAVLIEASVLLFLFYFLCITTTEYNTTLAP